MKELTNDNFEQFINDTITINKYITTQFELIKNSPLYQVHQTLQQKITNLETNKTSTTAQTSLSQVQTNYEPTNNQTKRTNALTNIISKAQEKAKDEGCDQWDSTKIYLILSTWADSDSNSVDYLPLLATTNSGIKYRDGERDKYLTKDQLMDRLYRLKTRIQGRVKS